MGGVNQAIGGEGKIRKGLRDRGLSAIWHHRGLEHRRTLPWGLVQHRFMASWAKEAEKASEHRQRKREAEEVDNVEVAPGVTVAILRCFRATLIGPTQGLPKRRRLC